MRTILEAPRRRTTPSWRGPSLTCLQRFGVERAADICKDDALAERSDAIAELFQDELEAAGRRGQPPEGPMMLLLDEDEVQRTPASWPGCSSPTCRGSTSTGSGRRLSASRTSPRGAAGGGADLRHRAHRRAGERRRRRSWTTSTPSGGSGWPATRWDALRSRLPGPLVEFMLHRTGGGGRLRRGAAAAAAAARAEAGRPSTRCTPPALVPGRPRDLGAAARPRAGPALLDENSLRRPRSPTGTPAGGSGQPDRAGARARHDHRRQGAGRVEEDDGGASPRPAIAMQKSAGHAHAPPSARERANPPPMIKEGELLQRRRAAAFPTAGIEPQ